ncbi:putative NAD/FAD-binding protein [Mumia flava]|uniref:Putative NAD/FAD-binding protein n=1 Tax=Mumia flava TaxID=1348852 RepID=A0A0B2BGB7_9ACTN|nr:FAD-dependent oxidoreductase [Mumia flava]PJJ56819.1 putative NAD/FAD-binding protein [Mumia flava]
MTSQTSDAPSVAVIGAGVSGLTAAYVLRRTHRVTLFEADDRLGGHAHTHAVDNGSGGRVQVDSGFIVHNERTYPHFLRLVDELGVRTRPTEMSMSITCDECGWSYAGGRGAGGILAQPRRVLEPRFVRMLAEVPRFHRRARAVLADDGDEELTWGQFLARERFSDAFVQHFATPLVACVWSSGDADALGYPARHLFAFLEHHGMLTVTGSPTWRTVVGGSRTYVDALAARLGDVRTATPVTAVTRHHDGVEVRTADQASHRFDQVVVAVHADQALKILSDADDAEHTALASITYSVNPTWLHRDTSVLPDAPRARASWNHRLRRCGGQESQVLVSYWMNRLQGLDGDDLVVTLNPAGRVARDSVVAAMEYAHPVFTPAAVRAAGVLRAAGGPRLAFAGAHLGWGFHEDGARSGVLAAEQLGGSW